jgi:RNA polymerase sigma-70 factor (ECF subfamily)
VDTADNILMGEISGGQVAKLAVLFERHHRPLFRYFMAMTRNTESAEDLVQDVFFRILRYRAAYDSRQSFCAWMYQIARNAHLDHAHKRRGEVIGIEEFIDRRNEPASTSPGPEETVQREILVLSRYQGLKYEEIAQMLGCEEGAVKVRVYRAMRALERIYYGLIGEKVS